MVTETKPIRVLVLAGILALAWHGSAAAQSDEAKVFVNVYVGAQAHTHSFATSGSESVYGETATFDSAQSVSGGLLVDFGGAFRISPLTAIGASFSTVSDTETATLTASVPSPIFFDHPVTVSGEQAGLGHRETALHIQGKITIPTGTLLPDGAWIALVGGPSFFHLTQDLIASITVPTGTQSVAAGVATQTGSGFGINAGFEARFPLTRFAGIGAFARYAGGNVDLDSVTGVKVGGLQAGVGLSVGF